MVLEQVLELPLQTTLSVLIDKQELVRGLANTVLRSLWPLAKDPDILACNPHVKSTCSRALPCGSKKRTPSK